MAAGRDISKTAEQDENNTEENCDSCHLSRLPPILIISGDGSGRRHASPAQTEDAQRAKPKARWTTRPGLSANSPCSRRPCPSLAMKNHIRAISRVFSHIHNSAKATQ